MSTLEITFRQAEALIEELKIILPTVEYLLLTAKEVKDINILASQNIIQLQSTIKDFDAVLLTAVAEGFDSKLQKLQELDAFERKINKNVQVIKNTADRIKPIQTMNSLLIFGVGFLIGLIALYLITKGV